ncbi:hypothetical protein N657DRAFT_634800 [Parathielavia appendiculata]|uniref:Ima1 N-terminal domain-containing protein n=1 Tax=Parathielavia appendiculata TaxID=2587402 RepID=A0AAN6TY23_9PEZI|nr:hypothetical protein N657DRAFT_634800 [Parathielavia appendiculata]
MSAMPDHRNSLPVRLKLRLRAHDSTYTILRRFCGMTYKILSRCATRQTMNPVAGPLVMITCGYLNWLPWRVVGRASGSRAGEGRRPERLVNLTRTGDAEGVHGAGAGVGEAALNEGLELGDAVERVRVAGRDEVAPVEVGLGRELAPDGLEHLGRMTARAENVKEVDSREAGRVGSRRVAAGNPTAAGLRPRMLVLELLRRERRRTYDNESLWVKVRSKPQPPRSVFFCWPTVSLPVPLCGSMAACGLYERSAAQAAAYLTIKRVRVLELREEEVVNNASYAHNIVALPIVLSVCNARSLCNTSKMPRLYRSSYLTCFYCGRKNSTLYNAEIRRFDCPFCDATNYLDELGMLTAKNGDITDPPVATDKEATPRQYAVPQAFSPPSSPTSDPIFCATCLKNQHLLSASLAQYLPDPDDPDYTEREKGLYRFRKNQERLYPQICAECEPKVRQRLEQAAYTAKTDLLRRMLDRSASRSKSIKTLGWLERADTAGRWLWIAGFVLQLAWHAVVVHGLLSQYFVWLEADESLLTFRLLRVCGPFVAHLPSAVRLLRWSILASILGVWWNPRFAQIFRGFTRHISGVARWYLFQAMAVALRIFLQTGWDLTSPNPLLLNMQTAGHAFVAAFAALIFILAPRAIHINMAPLFGATSTDLLDEISRSPTSPNPPSPVDLSPSVPRRSNKPPMGHAHTQAAQTLTAHLQQIDTLHLQQSPSPFSSTAGIGGGGGDEMDWSPTPFSSPFPLTTTAAAAATPDAIAQQSKYRAFNTRGQRATQPFGSAPTEPRKGSFWYRVPPAPTTPAQRVFNPPNRPGLRLSSVEKAAGGSGVRGSDAPSGGVVRFRGRDGTTLAREGGLGGGCGGSGEEGEKRQVSFAEPRLFAEVVVGGRNAGGAGEGGRGDPRNELSGMIGEGLKLDGEEGKAKEGGGWFTRRFAARKKAAG